MQVPADVDEILRELQGRLQLVLASELVGLYLRGSLALGDFNPVTSDVDFLAVVVNPMSQATFEAVRAMHVGLARLPNRYADHLEGAYMDREAARRFAVGARRHPEILAGGMLAWAELRDNWVLERWVVRERGVVLAGPDPATLIEPVSANALRAAALGELRRRVEDWADEGVETPEWLRARFMQAFEVETICRALHTIQTGDLCSKPAAVEWALRRLPDPWRADHAEDDNAVPVVRAFARWAARAGLELGAAGIS
jgi:hypothetical protein